MLPAATPETFAQSGLREDLDTLATAHEALDRLRPVVGDDLASEIQERIDQAHDRIDAVREPIAEYLAH